MDLEAKNRIVAGSAELFLRYGIKSITMDDIASHLSISKKTIYSHFQDKNALVIEVGKVHMEWEKQAVQEIIDKSTNAVEEIYKISLFIRAQLEHMNPSLIFDLKKYHPSAYAMFDTHKHECLRLNIIDNLKKGKEEGYYRAEINENILGILKMEEIELAFDPSVYSPTEFNIFDVHMELFWHFVMGILTPKGLALLQEYQKELNT